VRQHGGCHGFNRPDQDLTAWVVCVEHLFLRSPGQAPYGAKSACAKSAAYPPPPTGVPRPQALAAQAQAQADALAEQVMAS
jgi:hypothetical protein